MYELGKKSKIFGANLLRPLRMYTDIHVDSNGRPTQMPSLHGQEMVIAGYDQGLGERLFVCESLGDMQELYDNCALGFAIRPVNWYAGEDPGFVKISLKGNKEDNK